MAANPKVSIGLTVYNGENYLRSALQSLVKQTFKDFELIICDNASSDATAAICEEFARQDSRIRYCRNEQNLGFSGNFKRVVELSRGEYFKWSAHDDICLPKFLERCVSVLDGAPPSVVLVAPRTEIIDSEGKPTNMPVEHIEARGPRRHSRVAQVLHKLHWCAPQFGLYRLEALRKTRLLDAFLASDRVLLLELAILGEIWEIPEVLVQHRHHQKKSTSINNSAAAFAQWFRPTTSGSRSRPKEFAIEYARSIVRMPMPLIERFRCLAACYTTDWRYIQNSYRTRWSLRTRLKSLLRGNVQHSSQVASTSS